MNASLGQELDWHVIGIGAIGALWTYSIGETAKLILSSEEKVIALNKQRETGKGLLLESPENSTYLPNAIYSKLSLNRPIENLLVCTKAHQTLSAIESIKKHLAPKANIVLMQNGLGVKEELDSVLDQQKIYLASTTQGAYKKSDFHIFHAGLGDTWIGSSNKETPKEELIFLEKCKRSLSSEKFPIEIDTNIQKRLWLKLAINCGINPLTVKYQCRNGELLERPDALSDMKGICKEVTKVLTIKKLIDPNLDIFNMVKSVADKTKNNYSSMYQDVKQGKTTELNYINGFLSREAKKLDILTPLNDNIIQELSSS